MSKPKDVQGPQSSPSIIPEASNPEFAQKVSSDLVDDAAESLRLLSEEEEEDLEKTADIDQGIDLAEIGASPDTSRMTTQKIRTAELDPTD